MTTVSSTTGATSATSSSSAIANPYSKLGVGDFLTLLTTSLKNQDPTQPVDNSQMIADMSQFTEVNNTSTMSSTLSSIQSQLTTLTKALGVSGTSSTSSTTA